MNPDHALLFAASLVGICSCARVPCQTALALPATTAAANPLARCAPGEKPIVYFVGGDARNDELGVLPWAFGEAKARAARGFLFLGDMELTPELDGTFRSKVNLLGQTKFFPVLGNHEIFEFGKLDVGLKQIHEKQFRDHFLGGANESVFQDRVVYSVNLEGGIHFVALDNVSQPGFGESQLTWLQSDLRRAREDRDVLYVIVGMHKPLVNPKEPHSMAADGAPGIEDSARAVELFAEYEVNLVVASHAHEYLYVPADADRRVPPMIITGGLGAPLNRKAESPIHHVLELDVCRRGIDITLLPFPNANRALMRPGEDEDREHEK